jgi:hypothetical protein
VVKHVVIGREICSLPRVWASEFCSDFSSAALIASIARISAAALIASSPTMTAVQGHEKRTVRRRERRSEDRWDRAAMYLCV